MSKNLLLGAIGAALLGTLLLFMGTLALVSPAAAQGSGNGIMGSPHDFTDDIGAGAAFPELPASGGWNGREEICRVCHVPHDHGLASDYGSVGLLWNHAMSSQTFVMYAEDTHIQFIDNAADAEPTGTSKMCLGCHDGTVAIDQFDKFAGTALRIADYDAGFQVPGALFTGDLSSTHPLGVTYDDTVDPGLHPASNNMGTSGTIADVLDTGGKISCMSCHDVHDAPGESVPGTHLLRVNQKASTGTASGLCLTCHNK